MKTLFRRLFTVVVVMLLGAGCSTEPPKLIQIDVVDVEFSDNGAEWQQAEKIFVEAELYNPSAAVKILDGRIRVSYRGSRVIMLSCEDKIVIPARTKSRVPITLKVAVMRNSQAMALRKALERRDIENIEVDWSAQVRSRALRGQITQQPTELKNLLSQQQLDELWQMIDSLE